MDPISILLLAAVITKMVTTHREDVEYARKGVDSPRHKLKLAKFHAAQRAGQGGKAPARQGAKGYFRELWLDAWDDLHDYRRKTREANKANPRMTQREQLAGIRDWSKRTLNRRKDGKPIDDMVDVAGVRPDATAPAQDPWAGASEPTVEIPTTTPEPATASEPAKKTTPAVPPAATGEQKLAVVIPLFSNLKEIDMTIASAETGHILATRNFITSLDEHVRSEILPQLETCHATLSSKNVDPEVTGKLSAARDSFTSALATLQEALTVHDDKNALMEQAVNNTAHAAETDYYKHR